MNSPLVVFKTKVWVAKPFIEIFSIIFNGTSPNELVKITKLFSVKTIILSSLGFS